jgi:DNA ligase-associated metallophosphoesterase
MKWHALASKSRAEPLRLARSDCGSLYVELLGMRAGLRPSGALWLPEAGVLVAGDLHLEKGSSYAARGQLLPPYDTCTTLGRLEAEVEALKPALLVLLGDSFHDTAALGRLQPANARRIAALGRLLEIVWIIGNHDETLLGQGMLPGRTAATHLAGALLLRHEPLSGRRPGEVSGHLHPCAKIRGPGRSVRRRAFLTDGERLVLPAFGAYAGGLNARDGAFAGLFCEPPLAGVLGQDCVHPVAFSALFPD